MKYMETPRPDGDGLCSDDDCPCGAVGVAIPRGQGYIYISKDVVDFRMDCPTVREVEKKVQKMQAGLGGMIFATAGVFAPILVCEQGARKRGINMEVAAADARHWWATGLVPLRPTPMAGQPASDGDSTVPGEAGGCFIATACCGSQFAPEVVTLQQFRDRVLLKTALGRSFVSLYYRFSPPAASFLSTRPMLRAIIRHLFVAPLAYGARTMICRHHPAEETRKQN